MGVLGWNWTLLEVEQGIKKMEIAKMPKKCPCAKINFLHPKGGWMVLDFWPPEAQKWTQTQ